MPKVIGNTTVTPVMPTDWNQTDEKKIDYIKNKPSIANGEGEVSIEQTAWKDEAANSASGKCAVALGGYNEAHAKCSMAVNYDNSVYAPNAFAANSGNFIPEEAEGAFVTGHHNEAKSIYQTIAGAYSDVAEDDSFVVGNGSSDTDRSNAFKVKKNGEAIVDKVTAKTVTATDVEIKNKATIGQGVVTGKHSSYGGNNVTGAGSAAFGGNNKVYGGVSVAIGTSNTIPADLTQVFIAGHSNSAAVSRQAVFGVYADPTANDMLVVGNGNSAGKKNAFAVKRNGDADVQGTLNANNISVLSNIDACDAYVHSLKATGYLKIGSTEIREAQLKKLLELIG